MASANFCGYCRAGAYHPHAAERHPRQPNRSCLSVYRGSRRRQDYRGADPRQSIKLRRRADGHSVRPVHALPGDHPGQIDRASNRGIDEIRQIIENVRYQPAKCRFKIYIIDEVHQVTKDAFNALLKTLEEPPPSVKFILATTEPHRLPDTILSRCQRYDFRRISLREIVERLADIANKEGLKITNGALVLLAREADGSMRDAQSLLEQVLAFAEPAEGGGTRQRVDEILLQEILG